MKRSGGERRFLKPVHLWFLAAFRFGKPFQALFCNLEDSGLLFECSVVFSGFVFFYLACDEDGFDPVVVRGGTE